MSPKATVEKGTLILTIPMRFKRRSGRKEIVVPAEAGLEPQAPAQDALVTAVARAFRWRELMENGRFPSMSALAKHLGIDRRYVGRTLNLSLLAPDLVDAILAGHEPSGMSFEKLNALDMPALWTDQRKELGFSMEN